MNLTPEERGRLRRRVVRRRVPHDVLTEREITEALAGSAAAPPAPPAPADDLLRLAAACPRCGTRPAMRIPRVVQLVFKHAPLSASDRAATYQCQRRGCGAVYDLTADAFQRAV